MGYLFGMSFTEVLAELPTLTVSERQLLIRRALDLDEPALSEKDEAVVEKRLEDHRRNPGSAVPLEEMKTRLRSRFPK
jgi:putative addiction module component (TIGR02574 family)